MNFHPLPDPTPALPGTPEKVEVLRQRAAAREQLHHPLDARDEDSPGDPPAARFLGAVGRTPEAVDSGHGEED